jgi:hypothetical protein
LGLAKHPTPIPGLRSDLRRLYGEHAETALSFMLRTHRLGGTEALLEAAKATAEAT